MSSILLDTCAVIWIADGARLSSQALALMEEMTATAMSTYISPITAWEVGQLQSRNRLQLTVKPEFWFAAALARPLVKLAPMPPELLIASSFLPGTPPRDPSDRTIAATARDLGATLITRDKKLLDYGKQGHVSVVGC